MAQPIEDTIMKSIMELFKGDAVKFFGINKQVTGSARNELTHIPMLRKTDDWLWETDDDELLHIEFQSDYDKKDLPRFMISDAILHFNTGKPVKTIIVYSSDIRETITTLDAGAIQYNVEAFYMSALDGDKTYADIKARVDAGQSLTKQDLMSIVFLPMMMSSENTATQFEQAIMLSKAVQTKDEQVQVQEMLKLLAEKFIKDLDLLQKLKELINMGLINQMIARDRDIELAKNLLRENLSVEFVSRVTGLDESTVSDLKIEMEKLEVA